MAIVALNKRAVSGRYFGTDVKERGLIELVPYLLRENSEKHIRFCKVYCAAAIFI